MSDATMRLLFAGLLSVGVLNVLVVLGSTMGNLLQRTFLLGRCPATRLWQRQDDGEARFDPYGLDRVPWDVLRLAGAAAGVGMAALLFWERSPYLASLGLAGGYVPSLVRSYLLRRAQRRVAANVRHFLRTLKGVTPAYGGLYPALRAVSGTLHNPAGVRLQLHLNAGREAIEILHALAADLRAERLAELARRLAEAQDGLGRPGEMIEDVLAQMEREALREAKEALGGAPIRLLIPMLVLMVPPVLVLALYPPVARLLALIAGAGEPPSW